MAEILYGSWAEQRDKKELSSDRLIELIRALLTPITEAWQALQRASAPFNAKGDIRPIHCKNALNALNDLDKDTGAFCQLLRETDSLPIFISTLRYPLLTALYGVQEQTARLIPLINEYRISCIAPPRRFRDRRSEIYDSIESIGRDMNKISHQMKVLGHEVKFQERRLMAL